MIGLLAQVGRRRLIFLHPAQCFRRTYALSRFPERRNGFGRSSGRKSTQGTPSAQDTDQQTSYGSQFTYEKHFSADDSQLWESSQKIPSSDPEGGLKRLLLNNDTLVITRCVFLPLNGTQLNHSRQLEMLNIFMGFEQSNRYAISRSYYRTSSYT
jgi:hypothetical protein